MNDINDVFGRPREYKGLNIYPITMKDCDKFYDSVQCLMLSKNSLEDVQFLKMSYLRFLLLVSNSELKGFQDKLVTLLQLILQTDNFEITLTDKNRIEIIVEDKFIIRERDFDKIKTLISEQNLVDLDDEFINPEVKAKIDEARAFINKRGSKVAGLDQQIISYHCISGISYNEIERLTIYQFQKGLARFDHILGAEAIMNARYSGMVEFKDESKLPHWLGHIEDSKKNEGLLLNADKFKNEASNKLGMVNN